MFTSSRFNYTFFVRALKDLTFECPSKWRVIPQASRPSVFALKHSIKFHTIHPLCINSSTTARGATPQTKFPWKEGMTQLHNVWKYETGKELGSEQNTQSSYHLKGKNHTNHHCWFSKNPEPFRMSKILGFHGTIPEYQNLCWGIPSGFSDCFNIKPFPPFFVGRGARPSRILLACE